MGQFPWEGSFTVLLRRYKFVTFLKAEMGEKLSVYFIIYFWLHWVFVAAHGYRLLIVGASLVAEHTL